MAGTSISSRMGSKVIGKYGTYLIKKKIGNGGNGVVFVADIIEGGGSLPQKRDYAIKFLDVAPNEGKKLEKRKSRFRKEIETVLSFQDKVSGIIPIYDTSVYCEEEPDVLWYLMPKAERYNPQKFSVLQKMEQMFDLGNCIRQLHKLGFAHRDIKPKNLLLFDGRLCLSDFGLVRNIADTDGHITEMNEPLGPRAIRPPEFQSIEEINCVDYQKSDVYLYAKTIWMVLNCNNSGFLEEYSRNRNAVYIDKDKLQIETAEPLHRLMEEATKHYYWERIDIEGCLGYIEDQLRVIRGTTPIKFYLPLVEDVCSRTVSEDELSHLLDYLLDFACDEKMLRLYKRVCRNYLDVYPGCIGDYIEAYRKCGERRILMAKIVKETIHAKGIDIGIYTTNFENEFISLTDIAKYRNEDDPRFVIQNGCEIEIRLSF